MLRIQIPNFSQYQHYQTRMPPWIKLHKKLLDDYKFMILKGKEQMLLICLWVLASENPIEDDCGIVRLASLEELTWRLRHLEALRKDGGKASLLELKSLGFIELNEAASMALAGRKQNASAALALEREEREAETEREAEETSAPSAREGAVAKIPKEPAKKSWAREAAEDWDAHFGKGSSVPGRIGSALSRLVKAHGWPQLRPVWQRYIAEKDPTYASPQDFASKYQVWADGSVHVGGETIESHNRQETARFLDGEKGLQGPRGLARVIPPGKT